MCNTQTQHNFTFTPQAQTTQKSTHVIHTTHTHTTNTRALTPHSLHISQTHTMRTFKPYTPLTTQTQALIPVCTHSAQTSATQATHTKHPLTNSRALTQHTLTSHTLTSDITNHHTHTCTHLYHTLRPFIFITCHTFTHTCIVTPYTPIHTVTQSHSCHTHTAQLHTLHNAHTTQPLTITAHTHCWPGADGQGHCKPDDLTVPSQVPLIPCKPHGPLRCSSWRQGHRTRRAGHATRWAGRGRLRGRRWRQPCRRRCHLRPCGRCLTSCSGFRPTPGGRAGRRHLTRSPCPKVSVQGTG